jgi:hypothetical protein
MVQSIFHVLRGNSELLLGIICISSFEEHKKKQYPEGHQGKPLEFQYCLLFFFLICILFLFFKNFISLKGIHVRGHRNQTKSVPTSYRVIPLGCKVNKKKIRFSNSDVT